MTEQSQPRMSRSQQILASTQNVDMDDVQAIIVQQRYELKRSEKQIAQLVSALDETEGELIAVTADRDSLREEVEALRDPSKSEQAGEESAPPEEPEAREDGSTQDEVARKLTVVRDDPKGAGKHRRAQRKPDAEPERSNPGVAPVV